MNAEAQTATPAGTASAEPQAQRNPVPVWLFVISLLLLYWGMVYFDQRSAWVDKEVYAPYRTYAEVQSFQPVGGEGSVLLHGKVVYENVCALCHNPDGMGKPNQAPPFAGSEWALGSPERLIRIPLVGLSGPLKVKEQTWSLAMPAMGAALSDEDLAATLSYIRNSWGNKASMITPEHVKTIRAAVGNRSQPWSADELNAFQ
jgi:mono/diheme cytochrome c family protein